VSDSSPSSGQRAAAPPAIAWWLRALARLPWGVVYALAACLSWLLLRVVRFRVGIGRSNLQASFPKWSAQQVDAVLARHYLNTTQVGLETLKLAALDESFLLERVRFVNPELVLAEIGAGRSLVLLGAHQCNWEWLIQAIALRFKVVVNSAYKPLHSAAADRLMLALRSRFGVRMIAAKKLWREVVRCRGQVQIVAFMADQMPRSAVGRHWLTFLGRETAFYPGPAEMVSRTGFASFFVRIQRTARGHYAVEFLPMTTAQQGLAPEQITALYAAHIEAQIRAHPADWVWGHRRWKIKRTPADLDSQAGAGG